MASRTSRAYVFAAGTSLVLLALAGPAAAEYPTDTSIPDGEVQGVVFERSLNQGRVAAVAERDGGALPVTGGDLLGLTVIGAGAIGAGAVVMRRRSSVNPSPE